MTLKKGATVIPTNTLFLTFNKPDMPKVLRIGYLQVKVDLFVSSPLLGFGCNKFGHKSNKQTDRQADRQTDRQTDR